MLVELQLPLNCHLTVVRDLTSRKVVDDKDGRGPELVNYRKKMTSGITRSVRPYPLISNPVP